MDGLPVRTGGIAQLPDGLGGIELIVAGQVIDRETGHHGLGALLPGLLFHHAAHHVGYPDGQEHAHLFAARFVADHAGEIPEGHGFISQDVAFPGLAFVRRRDGAGCKIPHITEVEGTVDARGHFALDDLDQCAGSFTDGIVLRSHDAAGMDDTGVETAFMHRVQHRLTGHGLAAAVTAHHLVRGKTPDFADSLPHGRFGNRPGGGAVNQLFALGMA